MNDNKVLAIIGAGEAAFPIIKKAREMGITTVAFGESDSLAKQKADIFVEKSIFDLDGIVLECKRLFVNGVIASSEITTESTAKIAYMLGLPGNQCVPNFFGRNKYLMREMVKNAEYVKQPMYYLYKGQDVDRFPVMVKAIDACGKRGIALVNNKKELIDAVTESKNCSTDHSVLIEEYINGGQEISVECLANGKSKYVIQITDKITSGPPHFTEIAHHQPANINDQYREEIVKAAEEILTLLGINCGMAHLELKLIDGDIFFIEVGARAGGDHIADSLVGLSTDYDYYRGAIECSFGKIVTPEVHNVACSGIIFHCLENKIYKEIFDIAKNAGWCKEYSINTNDFAKVRGNVEAVQSGYIIYRSNHRLLPQHLEDKRFIAEIINKREDAFCLIWNHNKEIGRTLSDEELKSGIQKFIDKGNVIAVIDQGKIIAFLMLYCNNYETLEAYICNVFVLEQFRGMGLSKLLMDKAIEICVQNGFKTIRLHVGEDNETAINLYKYYSFEPNGKYKDNGERQIEMIKAI